MTFVLYLTLLSLSPWLLLAAAIGGGFYLYKRYHRKSFEKKAKLKLLSNNIHELETYVNSNVDSLSEEMVTQFTTRIETLKLDEILDEELVLKRRIEALPVIEEEEPIEITSKMTLGE